MAFRGPTRPAHLTRDLVCSIAIRLRACPQFMGLLALEHLREPFRNDLIRRSKWPALP